MGWEDVAETFDFIQGSLQSMKHLFPVVFLIQELLKVAQKTLQWRIYHSFRTKKFFDLKDALHHCLKDTERYKCHILELMDELMSTVTNLGGLQKLAARKQLRICSTAINARLGRHFPLLLLKLSGFAKPIDYECICVMNHHPCCGYQRFYFWTGIKPGVERKYHFYYVWQKDYTEPWPGCEQPEALPCYRVIWDH